MGAGRLHWDEAGEKLYHAGVKNVVLYEQTAGGEYTNGEAWNGVTSINENPSGAEETKLFADDIKYLGLRSAEEYGCTLGCYMYPDAWKKCDGRDEAVKGVTLGQQKRSPFGLSYVTTVGSDSQGEDYGYIIHLVYGLTASPSEASHETINDSPEAGEFSYEMSSTPVNVQNSTKKPVSTIEIESWKFTTTAELAALNALKDALYGTDASGTGNDAVAATVAHMPLPHQVISMLTVSGGNG